MSQPHAPRTHRDFIHSGRQNAAQVAVEVALHRVGAAVDGDKDARGNAQLIWGHERQLHRRGDRGRLLRRRHVDGDERERASRPLGGQRPAPQAAAVVATFLGGRSAGRPRLRAAPPWPHRLRCVCVRATHLAAPRSLGDVSPMRSLFFFSGADALLYLSASIETVGNRLATYMSQGAPSPCGGGWRWPLPPGWRPAQCPQCSCAAAPAPSAPPWPGPPGSGRWPW